MSHPEIKFENNSSNAINVKNKEIGEVFDKKSESKEDVTIGNFGLNLTYEISYHHKGYVIKEDFEKVKKYPEAIIKIYKDLPEGKESFITSVEAYIGIAASIHI